MYLVLRYAAVGSWRYAGSAVKDLCRCRGGRAPHADVGVVKEECHMIPHKVQEPHGPKVEAAQRLQRQARQGSALQLACRQCMLSCTTDECARQQSAARTLMERERQLPLPC